MRPVFHVFTLLAAAALPAQPAALYNISLATAALAGDPAGPFSLDFQLVDGDGLTNNTVLLTAFAFGGGSAGGSGTAVGGASGSLASGITLTDSSFFNAFTEAFTPGALLSFQILTTTEWAGGTPDQFSFGILDSMGNYLPTSFFDVFVTFDITGPTLDIATGQNPVLGAPSVQPVLTPEPAAFSLCAAGIALALAARRLR